MILKFRETHIGNMEKGRKGERCGGVQGCRDTVRRGVDGRSGKVRVAATAAEDPPPDERDASIVRIYIPYAYLHDIHIHTCTLVHARFL